MGIPLAIENSILIQEIRYVLFFGWPLSVFIDILLAPQGFFVRPYRVVLYVALGPLGTIDITRRAIRARAGAASLEKRPVPVRVGGVVLLGLVGTLLATGLAMAVATRWPDWYFPVLHVHRGLGVVLVPVYTAYLAYHVRRTSGLRSLVVHAVFSAALFGALLLLNPNAPLPGVLIVGTALLLIGSAAYVRRLDQRTEEGKSRGGLALNGWLLIVIASGLYLVPGVNARIGNNFGNYYYHLHGLVALFGLPVAVFLFLHHIRRTPRAFPLPARIAAVFVGIPFAAYSLYAANQKTHAGDISGYRNQRFFATATASGALSPGASTDTPHEWWGDEMNEVATCMGCHGVHFEQWQGSAHALSGRNLSYRAVLAQLIEQGRLDETGFCQSCHQPSLSVLADRRAATSPEAMNADQGVSCKVCHLTYKVGDPPRNGMALLREEERIPGLLVGGAPYRPPSNEQIRDDLRLHLKGFSNPTLLGSPRFCGNCHRIELPAHGPRLAALVLPNPYDGEAQGGAPPCKSCHMPYDTKNAKGVPFPNHHMFGVNTHLASMLPPDADSALRLAVAAGDAGTEAWLAGRGDGGVSFGVAATRPAFDLQVRWVSGAPPQVVVDVQNVRGGHPFPVGAPDLVEAWLFVEVAGPDGVVYASGELDGAGRLPESARRFGPTMLGADGAPLKHHDIMTVSAVGERRLLIPGEPRQESFSIPTGVTFRYPLDVRTELRYRRARRTFVDEAFGRDAPSLPVAPLATARCRVEGSESGCT